MAQRVDQRDPTRVDLDCYNKALKLSDHVMSVCKPKHRITVSAKYRDRVPQSSFITNYFYPNVVPNLIDANTPA